LRALLNGTRLAGARATGYTQAKAALAAGGCLARRSPIGADHVGRVRLGATRRRLRGPIPFEASRRRARSWRWCVKRSSGRVTAVFSGRSRRGRVLLAVSTARHHGNRRVRPGLSARRLRRAYPNRVRVARGVYRAGPGSRRLIGVRRGRVRWVGVASRRLLARPAALASYLSRAGVRH
jgi:hypothetical protein